MRSINEDVISQLELARSVTGRARPVIKDTGAITYDIDKLEPSSVPPRKQLIMWFFSNLYRRLLWLVIYSGKHLDIISLVAVKRENAPYDIFFSDLFLRTSRIKTRTRE